MSRNRVFVASLLAAAVVAGSASLVSAAPEPRAQRAALQDERRFPGDDDAARRADARPAARDAAPDRRGMVANGDGDVDRVDERAARRRQVNDDDWFRDRSYRDSYDGGADGGFPSGEVHDYVVANARAATARMMFRRAESALALAVRSAKRSFEASAELKAAQAAERQAHEAYERARRDALGVVVTNPRYQAIVAMHQDLGEQIAVRRRELQASGTRLGRPVVSPNEGGEGAELFSMAMLRMNVAGDARAMERDALEGNDELRATHERLVAAAAKVADMRRDFDSSMREDEDLASAREVLADARVARVTAAAYLKGSRLAADEAVDFAYFLHRYDAQVRFDPYFNYGYGQRLASRNVRY